MILKHTDKPVNGFMTIGDQARAQLDMMEIAMGGKNALDQHHCIGVSIGATSPLSYTRDPLETLLQYMRRNQMVHLLCAPLAGVSAPIGLMDTVVLQNAELLAGAHLLNEAVGIIDNILTVSYEKTIIDGELISRVRRIMQGIDGADCDINIDMIKEVGHGGNYLLHDTTFERCRERWRASLSYCGSYTEWEKQGALDIVQRANKTCKEILAAAPGILIDRALEQELKAYMDSELNGTDVF